MNAALRPETRTKLKKAREEVEKQLREDAQREKKEEEEEEKAAARKKARDERVSKLSAAEQQKVLEREKKRLLRKSQGKVNTEKRHRKAKGSLRTRFYTSTQAKPGRRH